MLLAPAILGTGGGGSPYHGLLNMRRLYEQGTRVTLIDPDTLSDDDMIAVVSNMGAPLVTQERLVDSRLIARAVEVMQDHIGRRFKGVMSIEIGGGNSIQPLMVAAHLNIPVVDADAMGRAYPEAQMTSFAVGDLAPYPLSSVDPRGNEVLVTRAASWKWMERTSRKVCVEFGSIASTCKAPRTGAEVKRWGIPRTTTKAIRLGHAVMDASRRHEDPIAAILDSERGKILFKGKIVDVERRTTEGFLRGRAIVQGDFGNDQFVIDFQNEWVVVWRDEDSAGIDSRSYLRARQRHRRGDRNRNGALWPKGYCRCVAVAGGLSLATWPRARRAARFRLRF